MIAVQEQPSSSLYQTPVKRKTNSALLKKLSMPQGSSNSVNLKNTPSTELQQSSQLTPKDQSSVLSKASRCYTFFSKSSNCTSHSCMAACDGGPQKKSRERGTLPIKINFTQIVQSKSNKYWDADLQVLYRGAYVAQPEQEGELLSTPGCAASA